MSNIQGSLLARNTLLNIIGQGLPLVVAIVSVPFVVRGLGTERYGVLALVWVILNYFSLFDLGLGRGVTKFVAEALGKDNHEMVPALVWSAIVLHAMLGVFGGLVLVNITPLLLERVLNIPHHLQAEARSSFYLLALFGPMVLIYRSLNGVLEASQRFDLLNAVSAPIQSAGMVLQLLGVLLGWRLPGIVAVVMACHALAVSIQYYMCTRVFPQVKGLPRPGLRELRTLLGFGRWVTVSNLIEPIVIYVDRFAIGILLTMNAMAYYSAPYGIATRLWIIPLSFFATLFPAFSAMGAQDQRERLGVYLSRSLKYMLLIMGPVVIILVGYAREILQVWLGPEFARESTLLLQVLAVGVLINSLASIPYALIQALGRPDLIAKFQLAELPLYVLLMWRLVGLWGITGAALAWSIRAAMDALLLFLAAFRVSSVSPRGILQDRVPQMALALGLFGLLTLGINTLIADWSRVLVLALAASVMGISVWRYLLSEGDRAQVLRLLRAPGVK